MEESSLQNTKEFVEMLYQKWYELIEPTREKSAEEINENRDAIEMRELVAEW